MFDVSQFRALSVNSNVIKGEIPFDKRSLKVAVCNGIASARDFIESGEYKEFDYVEVMACITGCIGGGGQPKIKSRKKNCP